MSTLQGFCRFLQIAKSASNCVPKLWRFYYFYDCEVAILGCAIFFVLTLTGSVLYFPFGHAVLDAILGALYYLGVLFAPFALVSQHKARLPPTALKR